MYMATTSLGTSFTYLESGNSGGGSNHGRSPSWVCFFFRLASDSRECHKLISFVKGSRGQNNWECTERCCNQRLLPSMAMLILGTFLGASYPLGSPPPGVGPRFPPSWRHNPRGEWRGHVLARLATATCPGPGSRMSGCYLEHLKTISSLLSNINTGPWYLSLGFSWKNFL